MNTLRLVLLASFFFAVSLAFTSSTQAQASRTWVSGVGDDVNPCSRTAPCKTFAGAIAKTASGGEISVLDPGGFGQLVISKSITVDGTGMLASILAGSGTAILINIADPKDVAKSVRIRGLSLNGLGSGTKGISVVAANKVSIEDTIIDGFKGNGIDVAAGQVFVRNTTIRNNTAVGVNVARGEVGLSDVSIIFNGAGLFGAAGTIKQFDHVVLYGNLK